MPGGDRWPGLTATCRGFSLIELMIAMVLGLAVMAGVVTLSLYATRGYRAMNRNSESIENGRYALNLLRLDIEHAGFFGAFNPRAAGLAVPASAPDPCTPGTPPLRNYADSLLIPVAMSCSLNLTARKSGTGRLVLLRASTNLADITTGDTYLQTTPGQYILNRGMSFLSNAGHVTAFSLRHPGGAPAEIRYFHVHVYYIRTFSQTSGDNLPTLMIKAPSDRYDDAQALVEGIENLQVQYGMDANGDGAPDAYAASPSSPADGSNIVTIRLFLLARSLTADPAHATSKTYDLGNVLVTPGDQYPRKVFSTVVRLWNVSGRRE